jgi:flagellar biosynthesis regulator FlaF
VKTEGQNTLAVEIRCSLVTLTTNLGVVLQSLLQPSAKNNSLLTKLRYVVVSIRVSALVYNIIKDIDAVNRIRATTFQGIIITKAISVDTHLFVAYIAALVSKLVVSILS